MKLLSVLIATGITLLMSTNSFAYWIEGAVEVDPNGSVGSPPTSVNNGFRNGGWFSTNIGHESVAHDDEMPNPSIAQSSSFSVEHEFEKEYQWADPTADPNNISIVCHGEVSGARSGVGYAGGSSNIKLEQDTSWLGASISGSYYQQSYQQGSDNPFVQSYIESNTFTIHWATYSGASGGRTNPNISYHAWAKTSFYTGEATSSSTTPN